MQQGKTAILYERLRQFIKERDIKVITIKSLIPERQHITLHPSEKIAYILDEQPTTMGSSK